MKAVHFGAGAIGRGFIGDLLHRSGYSITFVDVDQDTVDALAQNGHYDVYRIEHDFARETIDNVTAVSSFATGDVVAAIAAADIVTTSVWAKNLPRLAPVIAEALKRRADIGAPALNFIPCENAIGNGTILRDAVALELLDKPDDWLDNHARFPSTAVDRMVFDGAGRDGIAPVEIGDDFELVIEQSSLADTSSEPIAGAHYADDLTPFLERKLFIVNGGHARAAYLGSLRGYATMPEVFSDSELLERTHSSMLQASAVMSERHGFTPADMAAYVDFTLNRWRTPGVSDEISRVGRSPVRKLAADERLVAPTVAALEYGLPHDLLAEGIAAALLYFDRNDQESAEIHETVTDKGAAAALEQFTGLTPETPLFAEVIKAFYRLESPMTNHRRVATSGSVA